MALFWIYLSVGIFGLFLHVVFVSVFAGSAFYGVSSSGFYRCRTGGTDATDMIMGQLDEGGTGEGIMENKRIKEWKWKSRKLVGDHREGQDKEKGGKDENG